MPNSNDLQSTPAANLATSFIYLVLPMLGLLCMEEEARLGGLTG